MGIQAVYSELLQQRSFAIIWLCRNSKTDREWACSIVKEMFWYAWIGSCWHGEDGGRSIRSTLSHMLNLKVYLAFWLVRVGNQGKTRQVGRHWPSPDSLGQLLQRLRMWEFCCHKWYGHCLLEPFSLNMKLWTWKLQKSDDSNSLKRQHTLEKLIVILRTPYLKTI